MPVNSNLLDALVAAGLTEDDELPDETEKMLAGLTDEGWHDLLQSADLHQIWGVMSVGLDKCQNLVIPEEIGHKLQKIRKQISFQYYVLLSFTTYVLSILDEGKINAYVLKGVPLNSLYPEEEMRKLADSDIYIPDRRQFEHAEQILERNGFKKEKGFADFHTGWVKKWGDRICLLELHRRPCDYLPDLTAERAVRRVYSNLEYRPEYYVIAGKKIPVLPPAENAFQLLLHMLQHFMNSGFGLRMLCDWTVFWRKKGNRIDSAAFLKYLADTELIGFAWSVTQMAICHTGLEEKYVPWIKHINGEDYGDSAEKIYEDVIAGGEFGRGEKSRLVVLKDSSNILKSYVWEVHRVMRMRFPRMKKIVILWPVLWGITIITFLKNNRIYGRGKTADVFKSAKERNSLMKQMKVFGLKGRLQK